MKKVLCLLLSLLNLGFVFANDTYFFTSGGNLVPAEEKDIKVQMKSEIISIVLNPKYYEVTVDFDFYNHGDKVELLVGFPFFEAGIGGHGKPASGNPGPAHGIEGHPKAGKNRAAILQRG